METQEKIGQLRFKTNDYKCSLDSCPSNREKRKCIYQYAGTFFKCKYLNDKEIEE